MAWHTRATRTVYENPWIRVREDDVVRPDGTDGIYGVVEVRHPSVFVVALTEHDEILLVEVERYTVGQLSLEVPAGGSDGEDPLNAARRELREETGLTAGRWERIGGMFALNGVCDAPEHVFLARDLRRADGHPDSSPLPHGTAAQREEGIRNVRAVAWQQALELVRNGTITDGETIAALMYAAIATGRAS